MVLKAIIYEHGNFQGRSQELIPGSYNMASLGIPNDSLSSLKVENGLKVTLYEHEFSGRSKMFTGDAAWVGDDFNDITSSIKVEELAPPPPRSQKLEVPGTSEAGVEFTNTQSVEVSYTFTPSGTWTPNINNPSLSGCSAAGINSYPPEIKQAIFDACPPLAQYMKYPNNTPFALLAINKATGAVVAEVSQATTLALKPGETLIFVLNDMWGGYADNSGSITVNWSATSTATKVEPLVGGNEPVKKQLPDSWGNFYILDRNRPLTQNGEVKTWEIWAENTNSVQLMIYRPTGNSWAVVGKSDVKTPQVGFNEFSLPAPIQVQKGDCLGIYSPKAGIVSFSLDSGSYALGNLSGKVLFTQQGAGETAFSDSSNRTYAVRVKGNAIG